jgi:hypothetical protein
MRLSVNKEKRVKLGREGGEWRIVPCFERIPEEWDAGGRRGRKDEVRWEF